MDVGPLGCIQECKALLIVVWKKVSYAEPSGELWSKFPVQHSVGML